jgi:hypothetical protein
MDVDEKRRWLREWSVRVQVERGRGAVMDRATFIWEPEPLHPETVVPATLRDLYNSVKADEEMTAAQVAEEREATSRAGAGAVGA